MEFFQYMPLPKNLQEEVVNKSCGGKIISHPLRFLEYINQKRMYYNILGKTGVLVLGALPRCHDFRLAKVFWTAIN